MGWNGKIRCLDTCGCNFWTNGKIYTVVNGVVTDDNGCTSSKRDNFNEFMKNRTSKWEEVTDENIENEEVSTTSNVNHPSRYNQGSIECIDALESAVINLNGIDSFYTANAIKYLWRWKEKGGVEDLEKAKWYIDRLISKETENNNDKERD